MPTDIEAQQHLQTAEVAEAAFDWRSAVDAYERALSLLAETPDFDEAAVLTALGRCYWNLSDARTAWRTLRRAIALYQQRGDGLGQAQATLEITRIWGPPDRHRAMLDDAVAALGDADPAAKARLLMRYRWSEDGSHEHWDAAIVIAERHNVEDVLATRIQNEAWRALNEDGDLETFVRNQLAAYEVYARLGVHDAAAGTLRNAGFGLIERGWLDRGYEQAERCFEYATRVQLLFTAQLALMDMVAVTFARGEYEACEALLERTPGETDFRADLYRMWIAEARGDLDGALRYMVSPDRGGNAPGAVAQIHAPSAGVLFRSGRTDAARQAMLAFVECVENGGEVDDYYFMSAPMRECVLELADEEMLRKIHDSYAERYKDSTLPTVFATLQGRALAPLLGGVAAKLGLHDEAQRYFRQGLEFCERERCLADAELCRKGLAQ